MQRFGLSTYFFLGLLLATALPLAAFGLWEVRALEQAARDDAEVDLRVTAESVARALNSIADGHVRAMETVAAQLEMTDDWRDEAIKRLPTLRSRYGGFDSLYAADAANGRSFTITSDAPGVTSGHDYSGRSYFKEMQRTHALAVSNVEYGKATRLPAIHVAVPIFDRSQEWVGVLCGSLTLREGGKLARAVTTAYSVQHLVVLDEVGAVIAATPGLLLAAGATRSKLPRFEPNPQGVTAVRTGLDEHDAPAHAVVRQLDGPFHWQVIAYAADADIIASAQSSRQRITLFAVLWLLIALAFSAAMATWLGRPIRELAQVAHAISGGTGTAPPAPRRGEPHEVAVLLRVFRQMLDRLTEQTRGLEGTVAERTRALASTNAELEKRLAELRTAQSRLGVADRMASVGTLAAGVAHEINNPLAYVVGNLEYVVRELQQPRGRDGAQQRELLEALQEAQDGAERVRRIVKDLRVFSRAEDESVGPVALGPVLESCIGMAFNELRHRALVEKQLDATRSAIGNEGRLGQVFLNMLVNAAQSIEEGAADKNRVRVTTRDEGEWVVTEVRDTGCGIPPENLSHVFDPFFTTKPVGQGTGLGLAISQRIVSDVGGRIEVESTVGQGTAFRVWLRAAMSAATSSTPAQPEAAVQRRLRVMAIDDERGVLNTITRVLSRSNDVVTFDDAQAALERLAGDSSFDVILCDVMMPRLTGPEFFRLLRERAPALASKVIFLTGGAFSPMAQEFLRSVPNRVVEKPFSSAVLEEAVAALR